MKLNTGLNFTHPLFQRPQMSRAIFSVWMRSYLYFQKSLLHSLFWIIWEPVLYLLALGFGVGYYVQSINGMPYIQFFLPAMLVNTSMFVPFFENTYSVFTKLSAQKTYHTIILTPVNPDEITLGEILWSISKSFLSVLGITLVAAAFGLLHTGVAYLIATFLVLILVSWVFASLGMFFSTVAKHYDFFTSVSSGFIIPLSLFSGTYFPLDQQPQWLQWVASLFPLSHGVSLVRNLMLEKLSWMMLFHLFILLLYALVFTQLSLYRMRKKLIL